MADETEGERFILITMQIDEDFALLRSLLWTMKNINFLLFLEYWLKFFIDAGIAVEYAPKYASIFVQHCIRKDQLRFINDARLQTMGINIVGHCIAIVEYVKEVCLK